MTSPDFFSYLVQTTLAVSILIVIVLLVRRPFARAFGVNTAYMLWAIPAARLFMPPLPANWTLFGMVDFSGRTGAARGQGFDDPALLTEYIMVEAAPVARVDTAWPLWSDLAEALPAATVMLAGLWALGAMFVFGKLMQRQWHAGRVIKAEAVAVGPSLQTSAAGICQEIGLKHKNISVQTSLISSGPLVSGLARPVVLLPAWFEEDYTGDEQRLAILHEMMHIKRGDLWALLAAAVAISLQWFNPLAWLALGLFRQDQEAACDADVIELGHVSPRDYGATLIKAVRKSGPVAQPVRAASLPLNHALYERLLHMKNPLPAASRRKTGYLLAASVGTAALVLSACAVSAAQTAELDGAAAAETEVETEVEVETVFIDEESIVVEGAEGDERTHVRIVTRSGSDVSAIGQSGVFVGVEGSAEVGEATREFAEEMRRLRAAEGDQREEIAALRADFEARMEQFAAEYDAAGAQVRVMRFDKDAEWIALGESDSECSGGKTVTSTVVIERDGQREEKTVSTCGGQVPALNVDIDVDEVMAKLRESGQLTEERLAEVEVRLTAVSERLARTQDELDAIDFDVDVDVTIDED